MPVATRSGQNLKARLNAGGEVAKQIHNHEQMGKLVIYPTIALWCSRSRCCGWTASSGSKRATTVVAVLGVVAALAAAAQVTIAGHLGTPRSGSARPPGPASA